jgi:hypothetical protein
MRDICNETMQPDGCSSWNWHRDGHPASGPPCGGCLSSWTYTHVTYISMWHFLLLGSLSTTPNLHHRKQLLTKPS